MMNEITKAMRDGGVKDFFTLMIWCCLKVKMKHFDEKKAMTEKKFVSKCEYSMAFCIGEKAVATETFRFPCSICKKRVGSNCTVLIKCNYSVHKSYSGIYKSAYLRKFILCAGNVLVALMLLRMMKSDARWGCYEKGGKLLAIERWKFSSQLALEKEYEKLSALQE